MDITRRKFFGIVPASVSIAAVALGVAVLPKARIPALTGNKVTDEMLIAGQKAVDPPMVAPGGVSYIDEAFIRPYERSVHAVFRRV